MFLLESPFFCSLRGLRITSGSLFLDELKRCNQRPKSKVVQSCGKWPPLCCKLLLCVPGLHGWWGSCAKQIQASFQGPTQQMLVGGHHLRLLDGVRSRAPTAPGTRNQDGQHMQKQPRGSFQELGLMKLRTCSRARNPEITNFKSKAGPELRAK